MSLPGRMGVTRRLQATAQDHTRRPSAGRSLSLKGIDEEIESSPQGPWRKRQHLMHIAGARCQHNRYKSQRHDYRKHNRIEKLRQRKRADRVRLPLAAVIVLGIAILVVCGMRIHGKMSGLRGFNGQCMTFHRACNHSEQPGEGHAAGYQAPERSVAQCLHCRQCEHPSRRMSIPHHLSRISFMQKICAAA